MEEPSIHVAHEKPDLTRVPIVRGVLSLALPVAASQFLETSYNVVNGIWVGHAGTEALAAINAAAFFVWLIYSQLGVVSTGTAAVVANCVGARRRDQAEEVANQALVLALASAVLLCVLGLVSHVRVLEWMGLTPGVVAQGSLYLRVIFLILPAIAFDEVMAAILRGYGDARTPTVVWGGVLIVNIALLPVFVEGCGPVPALGIVGAGISTAIAMTLGVAVYLVLLARGRLPFRLKRGAFVRFEFMRDVLRIGFPTSFSSVVFCLVYMGLTRIISDFGTPAVAAVGIGHRVESVAYMTCLAFSLAAITMVGQNKGAGHLDRARRSAWVATGLASLVSVGMSVVMVVFPVSLAGLFSRDPEVVRMGAEYLRIIGSVQAFMALDVVLEGAFSGAGNTVPPMIISIPLTLARIPCAWWVAERMAVGLSGVWWVISGLMVVRGIVMAWWFSRGYWERHAVLGRSGFDLPGLEVPNVLLHSEVEHAKS